MTDGNFQAIEQRVMSYHRMGSLPGSLTAVNYGAAGPNENVISAVDRYVVAYRASNVATVHRTQGRGATRIHRDRSDCHRSFRVNGEGSRQGVR